MKPRQVKMEEASGPHRFTKSLRPTGEKKMVIIPLTFMEILNKHKGTFKINREECFNDIFKF